MNMSDLENNSTLTRDTQKNVFRRILSNQILKKVLTFIAIVILIIFLPFLIHSAVFPLSSIQYKLFSTTGTEEYIKAKELLDKSIAQNDKKLRGMTPKSHYLIINSTDNNFYLYKGLEMVRSGKCSTGKNTLLEKKGKKWLFKTPKGNFTVKLKRTNPVWTKPDWAFVEEGLPVPGPNHPDRFDEATLGDYALNLGDGYMIHGTVWQRYLGLPVTHGCIRLNDDDLEIVFKSLEKGSNVYIY